MIPVLPTPSAVNAPAIRQQSLFQKYFIAMFAAAALPLLGSGTTEAWFAYVDQRTMLSNLLDAEARSAADKIGNFLDTIGDQLGWAVQMPWAEGRDETHRIDALRVLRQAPPVLNLALLDGGGIERIFVSRIDLERIEARGDRAQEEATREARANGIWHGPVTYRQESEPFMSIAIAGNRPSAGIAIADINLKLIREVVAQIQIGRTGHAFVLDQPGRLIAHPDISLVLRGADADLSGRLDTMRRAIAAAGGGAVIVADVQHQSVVATMATVPTVGWTVIVEQPLAEALAPLYAALWRTGWLLLAGTALAASLAFWLARRVAGPIRLLEEGAERIGAGQFAHRLDIRTGDELERLAARFNAMAGELALSQERSERIARLKRFLAPQVAELVDQAGGDSLLDGQRAEVVAVFGDLRGFTAFAARAEPDEIMQLLSAYHAAVGAVVTRYEATLTSFAGDGFMALVNAPVPCPDPALRAARMAADMQAAVRRLSREWRAQGRAVGFGIGLAMGTATVGRIGYDNRLDYTAIGNVVNLASRLCSAAEDGQVLVDASTAAAIGGALPLTALGTRTLRGYDERVLVYAISPATHDAGETTA